MNCPKCGAEQLCPCNNCSTKNAGKVTQKWHDENLQRISCGHCGLTLSEEEWTDFEAQTYSRRGGVEPLEAGSSRYAGAKSRELLRNELEVKARDAFLK
jgi:phage terminase large subunit GpA-like protein